MTLNGALRSLPQRPLIPRVCRREAFHNVGARVANLDVKDAVGVRGDDASLAQLVFKTALGQHAAIQVERVGLAGGIQVAQGRGPCEIPAGIKTQNQGGDDFSSTISHRSSDRHHRILTMSGLIDEKRRPTRQPQSRLACHRLAEHVVVMVGNVSYSNRPVFCGSDLNTIGSDYHKAWKLVTLYCGGE